MYHYYLGILKFSLEDYDDVLGYGIRTKLNKFNPVTYAYILYKYIKAMFEGLRDRYKIEMGKLLGGTWFTGKIE